MSKPQDRWEELLDRYTAELARAVTELQREIATRKQVEEMLFQRNRELIMLNQMGSVLSSTLDVDQVLATLLGELHRLLDIRSSSVWLVDADTRELVCQHAVGLQSEIATGWRLPPGVGVSGWVVTHGQSLMLPDAQADERHYNEIDQKSQRVVRSMLCVPLKTRGNVIGVLNAVDSKVDRFTSNDKTLLELLASSAAIAIDNAHLVAALRRQTAELSSRNEELDAFAHTVAHDLKGPLGPLIGYAEILENDHARLPGDEVSDYLHIISASTQKMNNIIEELLLLAEARQSQVDIGPLDTPRLIAESLKRLGPMIEEYQAEVGGPSSWPTALGYGPWVEEVWVNYISNAIKYGGQPPRVELGATILPDGGVRFWVCDNGAGITPEAQARLFTPFTRLDQVRAKGHGLGLSIVRRIIEKLGGQVGVECDTSGPGSVFSFTLPSADPAHATLSTRGSDWQSAQETVRDLTV